MITRLHRVDDFFAWALATKDANLPKSPLAAALGYAINQRKHLELFLSVLARVHQGPNRRSRAAHAAVATRRGRPARGTAAVRVQSLRNRHVRIPVAVEHPNPVEVRVPGSRTPLAARSEDPYFGSNPLRSGCVEH